MITGYVVWMAGQGDGITSTAGDDGKNLATGKGVNQRVTENQAANVVNNYLDHNNPERSERKRSVTLDERLDRLEQNLNADRKILERMKALVDGNPEIRFVGLLDQLEISSRSDLAWKQATERRLLATEERLDTIEGSRQITIEPGTTWLFIIVGALALVAIFFILLWFQNAGQAATMIISMALILQGGWFGLHGLV